ncbi:ligase-associated DNA damage response DEXH box helicase [Cupriavidus sp. AcVe19-1a]|uniref:ligase-associated DNA damage response DEXH box helicase n=1 Tax=Cupriavidus sp. AcVe19-1a TaxID=2821359 RepID=UPI001AEAEBA6|nr:ligase-associated DNA damage response DEXH box helicase [Cupriavidus sp. AcVe19-1a]MBP0630690.1 ligase-associated DNA damage response DEXH box helicase [Cupriavidus sp. AcVe19-1a]
MTPPRAARKPAEDTAAEPLTVAQGLQALFDARGWQPFAFQREVWTAIARGQSGLLHATTGTGKTYAAWLGALMAFGTPRAAPSHDKPAPPLTVLWLTPMRALAADTTRALQAPLAELDLDWTVALRTGDTGSAERAAQQRRLPTALVTTPESLTLMLTRADALETLRRVRMVVVDEWHELIGNKRGVQAQLALARLRQWQPALMVWGLSATLGNLPHAADVLLSGVPQDQRVLVHGHTPKTLIIDTLLPGAASRFPFAGHLGLSMLPHVVEELEHSGTTLVFLNTRSQAELWYQALLDARPDWAGQIALHHGSLDRAVREWVELSLKNGELRAVVCTSSLDLGVDFLPVERVLQVGSPKGVARLLQRAGRSGHAPGRASRVTVVPTHSLELVEAVAARHAVQAGRIEARESPDKPLDVLVQHLVTVALGGGFRADALLAEVRGAWAYRELTDAEWQWCLDFVRQGGATLSAYPDFRRAIPDEEGVWRVPDVGLARRHRMSVGTIVSDATMQVRYWSRAGSGGASLGSVEEGFIARLAPGDCFLFGGRLLELVRVQEMTAYVRRATGRRPVVPRWNGGKMPMSTELAEAVIDTLEAAAAGRLNARTTPELPLIQPLVDLQAQWSALPTRQTLLAESLHSREGWHLFLYPFAGRSVHLGLGSLLAWRLGQKVPATFSVAVNDYGLELLASAPLDWGHWLPQVLAEERRRDLAADVLGSLNAGELSLRRFREIARVAGLIFQGYPGAPKSARQLQASSSLFYEVFRKHDPGNLLLGQAEREVLMQELDAHRLAETLERLAALRLDLHELKRPTPLSFPLVVEFLREKLSTEKLADRIARMLAELELAAGPEPGAAAGMQAEAVAEAARFGMADHAGPSSRTPRKPRRARQPSKPLPLL